MIGDAQNPPTLKATANFAGFGLIDGNHYYSENLNWISTNVFYRQVRNFVIDTTNIAPRTAATGMHWPTSQATSIMNVKFNMPVGNGVVHVGLFIESGTPREPKQTRGVPEADNLPQRRNVPPFAAWLRRANEITGGSAGFLSDLTFVGGATGASLGNQQYTMRNLVFQNCGTGTPWLAHPSSTGLLQAQQLTPPGSNHPALGLGVDLPEPPGHQLRRGHRPVGRRAEQAGGRLGDAHRQHLH